MVDPKIETVNQESLELSPRTDARVVRRRVSTRLRSTLVGSGLALLMLGWGLASLDINFSGSESGVEVLSPSDLDAFPSSPTALPLSALPPDEPDPLPQFRPEQMEGHWVRKGTILRDITIYPGGKATLNVQLDYFSALLYGREMNMELTWELEDDILTHTIVKGTPQANVDRLIRDFGDSLSYKVIKANHEELVLEDLDDEQEQHHWMAVK